MPDRVAFVALCWFVLGTTIGIAVGGTMFGDSTSGAVYGFFLAFAACFVWPWIMPDFIENWMQDSA